MSERHIRDFIRLLLISEKVDKEVLGEPDLSSEDERDHDEPEKDSNEQSVVSSIAGVTTPLGTGPTYPSKKKSKGSRKKKAPWQAAASGFANAKLVKKA